MSDQDNTSLLNAFGILRINVSRLISQNSIRTILVTSPTLGEGKSTISANLAEAFVQSGKKVVLLDADFYHPSIHTYLGLDNQKGLSDLLTEDLDWQAVAREFSGIIVLTSGANSHSANPMLETDRMDRLFDKLQKKADVIILDGPPIFIMDTQILASKVDGILLVIQPGVTLTTSARAMINQLNLMEANVLGVILNRVSHADTYYPNGYYYKTRRNRLKEMMEKVKTKGHIQN